MPGAVESGLTSLITIGRPQKGLFTGSEGEFVILRKAEEPTKGSEDKDSLNQAETAAQPEPDSDQRQKVDGLPGDTP